MQRHSGQQTMNFFTIVIFFVKRRGIDSMTRSRKMLEKIYIYNNQPLCGNGLILKKKQTKWSMLSFSRGRAYLSFVLIYNITISRKNARKNIYNNQPLCGNDLILEKKEPVESGLLSFSRQQANLSFVLYAVATI